MAFIPTAALKRDIRLMQSSSRPGDGFLHRLPGAIAESPRRQADHEIASCLAGAGRLTDQAEREIERRFLSNPARW